MQDTIVGGRGIGMANERETKRRKLHQKVFSSILINVTQINIVIFFQPKKKF